MEDLPWALSAYGLQGDNKGKAAIRGRLPPFVYNGFYRPYRAPE